MGIKELEENIRHEEKLAEEFYKISNSLKKNNLSASDKNLDSIKNQITIINNSLPSLLDEITLIKKLPGGKQAENKMVKVEYNKPSIEGAEMTSIVIREEDKKDFVKSASLMGSFIKTLKDLFPQEERIKGSFIAKISSKLFYETSNSIVKKGYFKKLNMDLRKANIKFLLNTYLSIMMFFVLISLFVGCFIFVLLLFINFSASPPFISVASGGLFMRIVQTFWIVLALPIITFLAFYLYPSSEASSISKKIDQELPFVVINMSAIAASEIEPSKMFQIIARSGDEHPYTKAEFEKVLNYINIYGYDVTSALKASAEKTSSESLRELFTGLSNSITSGTNLANFLDKRAETLLFNYKMEREQYTKLAETFMNIYISIVIAAPLVLMLTFFLMSMGGLGTMNIGLDMISLLIVLVVGLVNVFFIIFLQIKQPTY